jgi:hypothetical protein
MELRNRFLQPMEPDGPVTTNRIVVTGRQDRNRFLGFLKRSTNTGSGVPVKIRRYLFFAGTAGGTVAKSWQKFSASWKNLAAEKKNWL